MQKLVLLFLGVGLMASAQTKYLNAVYTDIEKTTHTYNKIGKDSLQLDFYKARTSEGIVPLIVFVHGGGFSGGQRDAEGTVEFATRMAKRGYAVASISYQLLAKKNGFGCNVEATDKINIFDTAADDIVEAVRFILKNDDLFPIDENKVILSGTSAGAEAALHLVYVKENNKLPNRFQFAGVMSFAGAVIATNNITDETAIPTLLFHGTNDNLVPYHISAHHFCNPSDKGYLMLYGSRPIADKLKGLGKSYFLFSILGGTHSWANLPMNRSISEISDFLFHDVINGSKRQTERTIGL